MTEEEEKAMDSNDVLSKLNLADEASLKEKIKEFYKERKGLRWILDSFQKEFFRIYNRKLKFTKDIEPVADEFKWYKELKKEIQRLENFERRITAE